MKILKRILAINVIALTLMTTPMVFTNLSTTSTVQAASSIKISKKKKTLNVGKKYTLKITGTSKKVKWTSSNKKVATVNSKGKVTAKKKGTATITAKVGGKKYKCKITVKKASSNKITQSNMMSKVGNNLKYFSGFYLGDTYGISSIYKLNEVTNKVKIPGTNTSYEMIYEVVGLKSINKLKSLSKKYMSDSVISRLRKDYWGDIYSTIRDYNGKVYWVMGGIGDGPAIYYKKAKVLSSNGDTTKIQLKEITLLGDFVTNKITVTVKYDKKSKTYKITDYTVKQVQ